MVTQSTMGVESERYIQHRVVCMTWFFGKKTVNTYLYTRYKTQRHHIEIASKMEDEVTIPRKKLARIRQRVLEAEKEKLNLDNPLGINNEIEQIIREEIDE